MSADRLREAARALRERAANGDYSIDPDLGLALADWLDNVTACCDECMSDPSAQTTEQFHALRIADLILGAES